MNKKIPRINPPRKGGIMSAKLLNEVDILQAEAIRLPCVDSVTGRITEVNFDAQETHEWQKQRGLAPVTDVALIRSLAKIYVRASIANDGVPPSHIDVKEYPEYRFFPIEIRTMRQISRGDDFDKETAVPGPIPVIVFAAGKRVFKPWPGKKIQ